MEEQNVSAEELQKAIEEGSVANVKVEGNKITPMWFSIDRELEAMGWRLCAVTMPSLEAIGKHDESDVPIVDDVLMLIGYRFEGEEVVEVTTESGQLPATRLSAAGMSAFEVLRWVFETGIPAVVDGIKSGKTYKTSGVE
jgi:hypothetical protein